MLSLLHYAVAAHLALGSTIGPAAERLTPGHAQTAAAAQAESLLVSVAWLAARLNDPNVLILHVDHGDSAFKAGHIRGARLFDYMAITQNRDNRRSELPEPDSLRRVLESLGVELQHHVILYGPDVIMSARAFMTLEYMGHEKVSIMDGGTAAWVRAGHSLSRDAPVTTRSRYTPRVRPFVVTDADWIQPRLGKPGMSLLDTRTPEEYNGTGGRRGIPSNGHLQGAIHVQWEEYLMGARDDQRLKPAAEIARMLGERGLAASDTVVSYCYIGYRASLSYFVGRLLGHPTRIYDGSYDDWSKRDLPLVKPQR